MQLPNACFQSENPFLMNTSFFLVDPKCRQGKQYTLSYFKKYSIQLNLRNQNDWKDLIKRLIVNNWTDTTRNNWQNWLNRGIILCSRNVIRNFKYMLLVDCTRTSFCTRLYTEKRFSKDKLWYLAINQIIKAPWQVTSMNILVCKIIFIVIIHIITT